jgi:hypothetical protein
VKAAIMYWSRTGNTEKVARAIKESLETNGIQPTFQRVEESGELDWFEYDLICLGFPSYSWRPPKPVDDLLNAKLSVYRKASRVQIGAPTIPGKYVLIFCTYSGPHTGIKEAVPAGQYAAQFFEHLGFAILGEWYIVGEFHGSVAASTQGRLGDIRGRPNDQDLEKVRQDTAVLLHQIEAIG